LTGEIDGTRPSAHAEAIFFNIGPWKHDLEEKPASKIRKYCHE